jgi:hypothetical protein
MTRLSASLVLAVGVKFAEWDADKTSYGDREPPTPVPVIMPPREPTVLEMVLRDVLGPT